MTLLVALMDRAGNTCRFPVEEDRSVTGHFLFCGAAGAASSSASYCPYHHAICNTGTVRRPKLVPL